MAGCSLVCLFDGSGLDSGGGLFRQLTGTSWMWNRTMVHDSNFHNFLSASMVGLVNEVSHYSLKKPWNLKAAPGLPLPATRASFRFSVCFCGVPFQRKAKLLSSGTYIHLLLICPGTVS